MPLNLSIWRVPDRIAPSYADLSPFSLPMRFIACTLRPRCPLLHSSPAETGDLVPYRTRFLQASPLHLRVHDCSQVICDDTYSNKSWCIVGQSMVTLREINQMEREMCSYSGTTTRRRAQRSQGVRVYGSQRFQGLWTLPRSLYATDALVWALRTRS